VIYILVNNRSKKKVENHFPRRSHYMYELNF